MRRWPRAGAGCLCCGGQRAEEGVQAGRRRAQRGAQRRVAGSQTQTQTRPLLLVSWQMLQQRQKLLWCPAAGACCCCCWRMLTAGQPTAGRAKAALAAAPSRNQLPAQRSAASANQGRHSLHTRARPTCVRVLPGLCAILHYRAARGSHHLGAGALVAPPVVPLQAVGLLSTHMLLGHSRCRQTAPGGGASSCILRLQSSLVDSCCQGGILQRVGHPGDGIRGGTRECQVHLQVEEGFTIL